MASMQTISKRRHLSKSAESSRAPKLKKKAKTKDRMALFGVVDGEGHITGYLVPMRLLPPISQIKQDLKERGTANRRGYFNGREFIRERDLTDEMVEEEDVGDILSHCIKPLAVRTFPFSDVLLRSVAVIASLDCAFFAVVQELL